MLTNLVDWGRTRFFCFYFLQSLLRIVQVSLIEAYQITHLSKTSFWGLEDWFRCLICLLSMSEDWSLDLQSPPRHRVALVPSWASCSWYCDPSVKAESGNHRAGLDRAPGLGSAERLPQWRGHLLSAQGTHARAHAHTTLVTLNFLCWVSFPTVVNSAIDSAGFHLSLPLQLFAVPVPFSFLSFLKKYLKNYVH